MKRRLRKAFAPRAAPSVYWSPWCWSRFQAGFQPRRSPATLSVAADGYLYFIANQLHRQARYHEGKDLRKKPYSLFRVRIDAKPVSLRKNGKESS